MTSASPFITINWTQEDRDLLPYGFIPNQVLTKPDDSDFLLYTAVWHDRNVVAQLPEGPWDFLHKDETTT